MESLIFLLAIAFIGYIVYWSIKNDRATSISEQSGLLRMPDHEQPGGAQPPSKTWSRGPDPGSPTRGV